MGARKTNIVLEEKSESKPERVKEPNNPPEKVINVPFEPPELVGDTDDTLAFRITTDGEDRHQDRVLPEGGEFTNFKKNPVFIVHHKGRTFPVGRVVKLMVFESEIVAHVKFDTEDEIGQKVLRKYRDGFLFSVSIGFNFTDPKPREDSEGVIFDEWELVEISAVSIPANPDANVLRDLAEQTADEKVEKSLRQMADTLEGEGMEGHRSKGAGPELSLVDADKSPQGETDSEKEGKPLNKRNRRLLKLGQKLIDMVLEETGDDLGMDMPDMPEELSTHSDKSLAPLFYLPPKGSKSGDLAEQLGEELGKAIEMAEKGDALGSFVRNRIQQIVSDDPERKVSDVIGEWAQEAGATEGAIWNIYTGETECPPEDKLSSGAVVLNVEVRQMMEAARLDGCTYGGEANALPGKIRGENGHEWEIDENGIRFLKSLQGDFDLEQLDEIPQRINAVSEYQDYPVRALDEWDGNRSERDIRIWASSDGSGDKAKIDWSKYKKGHLLYDSSVSLSERDFQDHKFQYIYIDEEGNPFVPQPVIPVINNIIEGGMGGFEGFQDGDKERIKTHWGKYNAKAELSPPWESDESDESSGNAATEADAGKNLTNLVITN